MRGKRAIRRPLAAFLLLVASTVRAFSPKLQRIQARFIPAKRGLQRCYQRTDQQQISLCLFSSSSSYSFDNASTAGPFATAGPVETESKSPQAPPLSVMQWLKTDEVKKVGTWAAFAGIIVGLRDFFPVIIGTFLLSLVGTQSVDAAMWSWSWVQNKLIPRLGLRRLPGAFGEGGRYDVEKALRKATKPPRKAFVAAYIVSVMTFIATISVALVPRVIKEGQYVVARISQSSDPYLYMAESLHDVLGEGLIGKVETFITAVSSGNAAQSISDQIFSYQGVAGTLSVRDFTKAQAAVARGEWSPERAARLAGGLQRLLKTNVVSGLKVCKSLLDYCTKLVLSAAVSLAFSFLVVFDLPNLQRGARRLRHSRLSFAYQEVVPKLVNFSKLVGTAFEVQLVIALLNTIFTAAGMVLLGLPAVGFLSLIVLICSFIPVAGIVMSTIPLCLVALSEYGVVKMLQVLGMVFWVHAAESYLIFPQLYSSKLKLHPLIILMALYLTEHLVGVQGFFLALPVTVYATQMIMGDTNGAVSTKLKAS